MNNQQEKLLYRIINFRALILLVIFNSLGFVNCNLCETCICYKTELIQTADCRGERLEGTSVMRIDLLMFDEEAELNGLNLAENQISDLPLDMFRNLKNLNSLNLSHNLLQKIPDVAFDDLKSLTFLDLSENKLTVIPETIFAQITNLETLNLRHNQFSELDPGIQVLTKLTWLDISHNNLSSLTDGSLKTLKELKHLDLSFNKIHSLGVENLMHLTNLESLYLNNNNLVYLSPDEVPFSITSLNAGYNMITIVPETLINLRILEIEYNGISELNVSSFSFEKIESLNFSGNKLKEFPNVKLETLDTLDLSYNELSTIPETLNIENLPELSTLVISGNPIKDLVFKSELNLEWLIARSLDLLESIEEGAFNKLINLRPEGCFNLTISLNKRLRIVNENAFTDLNLCSLDLSGNDLSSVPPAIIESHNEVNLQGNPFHCDCSLQWMLVDLIPRLYSLHPELLENLRCSTPQELKDVRMVHWYKWKEQVFCEDSQNLISKTEVQAAGVLSGNSGGSGTIKIESSTGMLAALIGAAVVLSMMVIIGIVWARKIAVRRSRRNRRF